MTVKELYDFLDNEIPKSLSLDWDNDGLLCCPEEKREVKKVLLALDVTKAASDYAAANNFDVIISHHPIIFKGLREINEDNYISKKIINLVKNNTSVMCFHTRLDAAEGGVNDLLCKLLDIKNVRLLEDVEKIGRIGELEEETTPEEFAKRVKIVLGAPFVKLASAGRQVKKVAVLGGSGDEDLGNAISAGADTYLTGELKFHQMTDGPDGEINLIEAGHFYTENPVLDRLCELVKKADENIRCEKFKSDRIKII